MKLGAHYVFSFNCANEVIAVIADSGSAGSCVTGHDMVGMHKIEMAVLGNTVKESAPRNALYLIPPHVGILNWAGS